MGNIIVHEQQDFAFLFLPYVLPKTHTQNPLYSTRAIVKRTFLEVKSFIFPVLGLCKSEIREISFFGFVVRLKSKPTIHSFRAEQRQAVFFRLLIAHNFLTRCTRMPHNISDVEQTVPSIKTAISHKILSLNKVINIK